MTNHEIDQLMKKIASGDISALEQLYVGMKRAVYFYALHLSDSTEIAEDVMQETFISVMKNSGRYKADGKGKSWIFTIAKNKVLDCFKRQKPTVSLSEIDNMISPANPIDEFVSDDSIKAMLSPLNKKERDIVILRVLVGFNLTEVARELGLPKGSVFWSYNNAMKKLKNTLKGDA